MTREEVQARLEAFLALLDQEQAIKEELLALKMYGRHATEEEMAFKLAAQQELIEAIERLRREEMLPILEEMASFVGGSRLDHVW